MNSSLRNSIFALLVTFSPLAICFAEDDLTLGGVDIYGTDVFDGHRIEQQFSELLSALVAAIKVGNFEKRLEIERQISKSLLLRGEFASLDVSSIRYFPPVSKVFVTIDVVESRDAARRIRFNRETDWHSHEDPQQVIHSWSNFTQEFYSLAASGNIQPGDCEALHCLASFLSNDELKPYLEIFDQAANMHTNELHDIALTDTDPRFRSSAILILAHSNDVDKLINTLRVSVFDPHVSVRNNAIRVLAALARRNKGYQLPVNELIAAMDFPMTTDRNKATYAVAELAMSPEYSDVIKAQAIPIALRLLRLDQPNNHEAAYELLRRFSGKNFPPRDYAAWEQWYSSVVDESKQTMH